MRKGVCAHTQGCGSEQKNGFDAWSLHVEILFIRTFNKATTKEIQEYQSRNKAKHDRQERVKFTQQYHI